VSIAEVLQTAMDNHGLNTYTLAQKAKVDRFFLTRLLQGYRPPRMRKGRKTAKYDERYKRLARMLDIEEEPFLELVESKQLGGTTSVETTLAPLVIHVPSDTKIVSFSIEGNTVTLHLKMK